MEATATTEPDQARRSGKSFDGHPACHRLACSEAVRSKARPASACSDRGRSASARTATRSTTDSGVRIPGRTGLLVVSAQEQRPSGHHHRDGTSGRSFSGKVAQLEVGLHLQSQHEICIPTSLHSDRFSTGSGFRGRSWDFGNKELPVAHRCMGSPGYRIRFLGFRIVRSLP